MRIYFDTEFLENGRTIKLISIGLIREDGLSYYAVVRDSELMEQVYDHLWLRKNVIPSLPVKLDENADIEWDASHTDWKNTKSIGEIAKDVRLFITDTPKAELWAYYSAYDHVALCQLWGTMVSLPHGIPMYTNDLKQEIVRLGSPEVPKQATGHHNALADAIWNKETYEYLQARYNPIERLRKAFLTDMTGESSEG